MQICQVMRELVSPFSVDFRGIRFVFLFSPLNAFRAVFLTCPFFVEVRLFVFVLRFLFNATNFLVAAFCFAVLLAK